MICKDMALLIYLAESNLFLAEIRRKDVLRNELVAYHISGFLSELASQVSEAQESNVLAWNTCHLFG